MAELDLAQYGIKDVKKIIHNPSYEDLFKDETNPALEGYEKGILTDLGAVDVMTGVYRTPYGGHPMNIRTTTSPSQPKSGIISARKP